MTVDEIRRDLRRRFPLLWMAAGLIAMGMMIVMISLIVESVAATSTAELFTYSKADRDGAEAASDILRRLGVWKSTATWTIAFKFFGVASFIAGFGMAFAVILTSIRLRASSMAAVLPIMTGKSQPGSSD